MKKEIEVAAKWWADRLKMQESIATEQREKFVEALQEKLRNGGVDHEKRLSPDLHTIKGIAPSWHLTESAEEAGIDHINLRLPVGVWMWIDQGKVSVSTPSDRKIQTIYEERVLS